jgi:hypothetical protein
MSTEAAYGILVPPQIYGFVASEQLGTGRWAVIAG